MHAGALPTPRDGRVKVLILAVAGLVLFTLAGWSQLELWLQANWTRHPTPDTVNWLLLTYLAINAGLFIVYLTAIRLARAPSMEPLASVLLVAPIVFMVTLLVFPPSFSVDVLSYLAHGATSLLPGGGDAYSTLPKDVAGLPYARELLARGWNPAPGTSPYGPVWSMLETAIVRSSLDVEVAIRAIKVVALLSVVGSAALIWRILRRIRPEAALSGTVAFLWNPVVILELAGEGHNDGLMVLLCLAGLYAAITTRPTATVMSSVVGALVKYVPVLFLIPQFAYLWRWSLDRGRLARRALLAMAAAAGLAALAYIPFAGPHVLDGVLRSNGGGPWPLWPSVTGLLYLGLQDARLHVDPGTARTLILGSILILVVIVQSVGVTTPERLIRASSTIAITFVYLVAAAWWPWYAVLPIAFLALERSGGSLAVLVVASVGSRLAAPLGILGENTPFPMAWELGTLAVILVTLGAFLGVRMLGDRDRARLAP